MTGASGYVAYGYERPLLRAVGVHREKTAVVGADVDSSIDADPGEEYTIPPVANAHFCVPGLALVSNWLSPVCARS